MSEEDEKLKNQSDENDIEKSDDPEPEVLPPDLDFTLENLDPVEAYKNLDPNKNI